MKYLLDTNVYLTALRSASDRQHFETTFYPLLPATVLSAVVAYELGVDAANRRTRELLKQFIAPMQSAGRVVAPAFDDWIAASGIVSAIESREPGWRSKLAMLLDDVLIALSGRRVRAMVITYNGDDFRLIRRHASFELRVLTPNRAIAGPKLTTKRSSPRSAPSTDKAPRTPLDLADRAPPRSGPSSR